MHAILAALALASATPVEPAPVTVTAAPGDGVVVKAADGAFTFQVRGRMQVRAEASGTPDDDATAAFEVRRARLVFAGDLWKKTLSWTLHLGLAPRDIESENPSVLRDAYATWHAAPWANVRLGQMKIPFDRQRITSSASLEFPERADVENELTLDRDIGMQVYSAPLLADWLTYQVGVFGGDGRNKVNTGDVLTVARVQLSPLGAFDDMIEGAITRDPAPHLAFSVAGAWNPDSPRARSTLGTVLDVARIDYAHATADVVYKQAGVSLLVEGLARAALAVHDADAPIARSGVGGLVQLGVFATDELELVGRIGRLQPMAFVDGVELDPAFQPQTESRMCANFYWHGHDVKLQNDVGVQQVDGAQPKFDGHIQLQLAF